MNDRDIQALIRDLGGEDEETRCESAQKLVEVGEFAIPYLIDTLKDNSWMVRQFAAFVLGKIGDERAVPALIDALKDEDFGVRKEAAHALSRTGDERAVPSLITALNDEDWRVRDIAALALGEIAVKEVDISAAYPDLIEALKDKEMGVRITADTVLEKIREKSMNEGNYPTALTIIKAFTLDIRKKYKGKKDRYLLKERREKLAQLESLTQQIYDMMNSDKKTFPVKRQEVKTSAPVRQLKRFS